MLIHFFVQHSLHYVFSDAFNKFLLDYPLTLNYDTSKVYEKSADFKSFYDKLILLASEIVTRIDKENTIDKLTEARKVFCEGSLLIRDKNTLLKRVEYEQEKMITNKNTDGLEILISLQDAEKAEKKELKVIKDNIKEARAIISTNYKTILKGIIY